MSSEINKLSNLVSNHLKIVDKRITGNEQFHWNRLKRTPQILKQKIKFAGGSYTVDQTFNELDEELLVIDASIKKLIKYTKVFGESMNQVLSNSVCSAESFQNLIDPYTNLKSDSQILEDAYATWSKITKYKHKVKDVFVENEIDHLVSSVTKKDNPENEKDWLKLLKVEALGIPSGSHLLDERVSLEDLGDGPSSVTVYGRVTNIPLSFNNHSICYLDFKDICQGLYSSSDYITIASTFRCIILDNVPVMTTKMKNDARRFITFLDAIYESRCQFFMRSDIEIDYLFFPDVLNSDNKELMDYVKSIQPESGNENIMEVQDEEMFARTSIDMNNPYRPNISTYDQSYTKSFDDFKSAQKENINNEYMNTRAFTGDDEKFAFKRAVSRVKEMVASETWRLNDRWVPLDHTMRPWESSTAVNNNKAKNTDDLVTDENQKLDKLLEEKGIKNITLEIAESLPREYSRSQGVLFRLLNSRIAPIFDSLQHYWAIGKWSPENGKRLKDSIARSWIRSSVRKK